MTNHDSRGLEEVHVEERIVAARRLNFTAVELHNGFSGGHTVQDPCLGSPMVTHPRIGLDLLGVLSVVPNGIDNSRGNGLFMRLSP